VQRLNVDLPQSQYFALKSFALHANKTVSQLVRESLQQVIDYDAWFRARVESARAEAAASDGASYSPKQWEQIRQAKRTQSLAKAKPPGRTKTQRQPGA
jgi:hypothetical protein